MVAVVNGQDEYQRGCYLGNYSNSRKAIVFWDESVGTSQAVTIHPQTIISSSNHISPGPNKVGDLKSIF